MTKCVVLTLLLLQSFIHSSTFQGDSTKYVFDEVSVIGVHDSSGLLKAASSVEKISISDNLPKTLFNTMESAPGILLQQKSGGSVLTKISMRGFGYRSNDPQITGIKVLIDGFPETEPDGRTPLDLVDISAYSQVEIGRTNSYNLFSPASGGYLNFISERNFTGTFSEGRYMFGSFGYQKYQLETGTALKNGSIFLNLSSTTFGGWRAHSASSATNFNFYFKNRLDEFSSFNVLVAGVSSAYKIAGPLTSAQIVNDETQANPTLLKRDERRTNKILRIGLAYQRYLDDEQSIAASFFLSPRILMRSQKNSYRDFNRIHLGGKIQYNFTKNFSEQIQNRLSVGVDNQYQTGPSVFYSLSSTNERGTTLKQNKNEGGLNYGFYVSDEVTWNRFVFDGSVRYSMVRYLLDDFIDPTLSDKLTMNSVTPGIGVSYKVAESNYAFVHYAKGVETPAFNEVDPPAELASVRGLSPLLKPATSHTVELGLRGFITNEENFVTDIKYSVVAYSVLTYGELIPYQISGSSYMVSSGKTSRYGLEASGSLSTKDHFIFESSLTLSKNKFTEFFDGTTDFSGKQIPGLPAKILFLSVGYNNPLLPFVNLKYTNFGWLPVDNANIFSADGYGKVDLLFGYAFIFKKVNVNCLLQLENLTNAKYVSSVYVNGSNGEFFEPGLPRNFSAGITLNYKF